MVLNEKNRRLTSKMRFINMTTIFCKVKNYFDDGMQRKKELHTECLIKQKKNSFNESLGVFILKRPFLPGNLTMQQVTKLRAEL